jgi:hypothetical protein|tara:strand:+ start:225 stop:386 length:162 start_codon:yes stop_codon:yes gene_type:complete
MKEKNPEYTKNAKRNKNIATRCRVCGGQLLNADEMKKELHDECDKDNKNIYVM